MLVFTRYIIVNNYLFTFFIDSAVRLSFLQNSFKNIEGIKASGKSAISVQLYQGFFNRSKTINEVATA